MSFQLFKKSEERVVNEDVKSFVSLKDINKIYPNGIQAVYDFNIDIDKNEFIVLVGPSGCGKSTTLRMIAGLEDISSGSLYIDKVLSNFTASKNRDISMVFQSYALYPQMTVYENIAFPLKARKHEESIRSIPNLIKKDLITLLDEPEKVIEGKEESKDKSLNYSSSSVYLSTKLKVSEKATRYLLKYDFNDVVSLNGLKSKILADIDLDIAKEKEKLDKKGVHLSDDGIYLDSNDKPLTHLVHYSKEEIRNKVFQACEVLDLGPYLDRRPKELSGGQMQRVALGRAIVRNSKLFLMDEPLSNLDAKLRVQMRSEIVRLHERVNATTIYVTHDQTEAMTMATRIAVMSKGYVQQIATPTVIYNQPSNIFVATFIGSPSMNIFDGTYEDGSIIFTNGYRVTLGDEYKRTHDAFYKEKIEETKEFLSKNPVIKMHGLIVLDELVELLKSNDVDGYNKKVEELTSICNSLSELDEDKAVLLSLLSSLVSVEDKLLSKQLNEIRTRLLNIKDIDSKQLSILHNAQVFNKDKKDDREEVLFYRKKAMKKDSSKKVHISIKGSDIVLTNNLYTVLSSLLEKYENCLKSSHPISIGVRPEHIHLFDEYNGDNKSDAFTVTSDVVELLGSELLLHCNFSSTDMIAKITTEKLIKPHQDVNLTFEKDKIYTFDTSSGDTIASYNIKENK